MVSALPKPAPAAGQARGFSLIELVVVLAIVALLLALATPNYFHRIDKSRETILRANLAATRDVLDKFYDDNGKYPEDLQMLVERKYLRRLPLDPITDSTQTWIIVAPDVAELGGVADLRSGAAGESIDGTPYRDW